MNRHIDQLNVLSFIAAIIVATTITIMATPVMAYEEGDWLVKGRIVNISANNDSGDLYLLYSV